MRKFWFLSCIAVALAVVPAAVRAQAAPQAEARMSAAAQRELVETLCCELDARYVYPDVARAMSARLRERLAQGAYASLTAPRDLADQLQQDLRAVSRDRHLFVTYDPKEAQNLKEAPGSDDGAPTGDALIAARRQNYGLRKVEILDGNVGYLDVRDFEHPNLSVPKIAAAMALIADCDAAIVDLRSNGGGWASTTAFFAAYFFPAGTAVHFTDFYDRPGDSTAQSWTPVAVPGRTLPDIPLFVLISERTFSGAEEIAYNLKHLKRATLVGDTTRGGANNPGTVAVADQFVLWVPQGRPINPITKGNWEGVGVAPDVVVPESQALDVAHQQVLERLFAAATADDERYRFQWALDGVRARVSLARPDARTLAGYAGTYGRRQILFEGGVLYDQREDRPRQAMIPLGPDFFAVHGLETQRLRFVREGGRVTGLTVLGRSGSSQTAPRVRGSAPARK